MPIATLTFNLPEDQPEFRAAVNGQSWQALAWEIDQHLRSEVKYASDETPEAVIEALAKVREFLREQMNENGLSFE